MDRTVRVLGVPMDHGVDRRGVDMGPSAIRYGGLAAGLGTVAAVEDHGDLSLPRAEERPADGSAPPYLEEIDDVTGRVADWVAGALADGACPLVLGGDHSVAIGSVAGSARAADVGVVWFDAHADLNTPAVSPTGNVHGMPVAAILGRGPFGPDGWDWAVPGLAAADVAYVGLRSLDPAERERLRESDMTVFTMADVDDRGIAAVTADALAAADAGDGVHVSLDADVVDPRAAPGVGTPVNGGLTYREAHAAMETVASAAVPARSIDVVEVNPILDRENATGALAAELAASACGKRIL